MSKCSITDGVWGGGCAPSQIEKNQNLTADHELFPKKKNTTDCARCDVTVNNEI